MESTAINPNPAHSSTQAEMILAHLRSGKRLTPMEAFSLFGCMRLGARIYDLRTKQGVDIRREMLKLSNGKQVAQYHIDQPEAQPREPEQPPDGWQPMETAPKDGTKITLRIHNPNRQYAAPWEAYQWEAAASGSWTDHNGGGWTWSGMAGTPVAWKPIENTGEHATRPTSQDSEPKTN